ncbi:MAG: SRPBCC family protein [Burkholderiaceae bacterium]|jgi:uncharacterized protein YndB with AHSA1/START domain
MTKSAKVTHGHFSIERDYPVSTERLFYAWSNLQTKAKWFVGPPGWNLVARELDFRIEGRERLHGRFASGLETVYTATFYDIVPGARIVFVYDMHLGSAHHSVSIATVEIEARGDQARLQYTEQVAFLDGTESEPGTASRKQGTGAHFERLSGVLLS